MKLFINQTSPYARKVRMVVKEKKLDSRVTLIDVDPWNDSPALLDASPLSKVPALVTGDGIVLTESDTIARYLDELVPSPPLMPADFAKRTEVISRVALLQGMIDAAFDAVIEKRRPASGQWPDWIARQQRAVGRGLVVVAKMSRPEGRFDMGDVSLVCLLGYLDFRHPAILWRTNYPELAKWFDVVSQRASAVATGPEVPIS